MIIIEGVDRTGKSTLARELSKKLYMPVVNRLRPEKNIFTECINFLANSKENYIVDRFHLSELAYGPVKRGKVRFDFRELKIIELALLSMHAVGIYCGAPEEKIAERFRTDSLKETFLSEEDILPVLRQFDAATSASIIDWEKYEIGDDISELSHKIGSGFTQDALEDADFFRRYRTIGDYQNATTLIVGEKYGDKLLEPLVPFGNNLPGLGLFESLDSAGIDWKKVVITNAIKTFKICGATYYDDRSIIKELSFPKIEKVICLGEKSYDFVCKTANSLYDSSRFSNLKFYKVHHPSSVFAYHNISPEEYVEELRNVLSYSYLYE